MICASRDESYIFELEKKFILDLKTRCDKPENWGDQIHESNKRRWSEWRSKQNLDPRLKMVPQFAEEVGCCTKSIKNWIRQGLPSCKIGIARYIHVDEAKKWLLERREKNRRCKRIS